MKYKPYIISKNNPKDEIFIQNNEEVLHNFMNFLLMYSDSNDLKIIHNKDETIPNFPLYNPINEVVGQYPL